VFDGEAGGIEEFVVIDTRSEEKVICLAPGIVGPPGHSTHGSTGPQTLWNEGINNSIDG
jgi:hypothetical protein